MSQTLLEIGSAFAAIAALLDELDGGEIPPDMEEMLDHWFAEMGPRRDAKLDSYVAVIRNHELRAVARRAESDRLLKLVKADEGVARRLTERLKLFMEITKQNRVETERYRISLRSNGGKPPLEIDEVVALPQKYLIVERRPNKDMIRDALMAGHHLPGCRLLDRATHLRID